MRTLAENIRLQNFKILLTIMKIKTKHANPYR